VAIRKASAQAAHHLLVALLKALVAGLLLVEKAKVLQVLEILKLQPLEDLRTMLLEAEPQKGVLPH